ncbi:hypothetical protein GDO78_002494 [Eleutherodactylus coqui]|uniref:Uncharacterized protein n=1 Tax=Eleutherodactylus coqui TaxID=57060 RepID=A0A8J6EYE2_ELECQ|nr:hypothetical protein GDO78_002494 [Eleutherodactylus coqui]
MCTASDTHPPSPLFTVVLCLQRQIQVISDTDDSHVHVKRPKGKRLHSAFAMEWRTASIACVIPGLGAIACDSQSPLVVVQGTMTALRYVQDILLPRVAFHEACFSREMHDCA